MCIQITVHKAFETIIDGIVAERIKHMNSQEKEKVEDYLRGLFEDDLKLKILRQDVEKYSCELIELLEKVNTKSIIRIYQVEP